jgi:hypothetical protein
MVIPQFLVNFSIHNSIPLTSTSDGKNVWILGDVAGFNAVVFQSRIPRKKTLGLRDRIFALQKLLNSSLKQSLADWIP